MKKALIIGSNGYLGEYWICELQSRGFETFGISIGERNQSLAEENYTEFDISTPGWPKFIESYLNRLKPDVIIYNSGIDSPPGMGSSRFIDFELASWHKIFEVNLFGAVSVLNTISEIQEYNCRVVLIGSQYATLSPSKRLYDHQNGGIGSIKHPGYSASKSALKAVMRQYATELAERGFIINMLSPGGIENNQDQEFVKKFSERVPVNRMGRREELGSALNFLLDENNSFCIGIDLLVDGGYSAW